MELFSKAEWSRTSWIESANDPTCGFPLQSLPYCIFTNQDVRPRPGIGIGAFFFLVALVFVYRSFYGMRIPEEQKPAVASSAVPKQFVEAPSK